jgi:hypothetical protein
MNPAQAALARILERGLGANRAVCRAERACVRSFASST